MEALALFGKMKKATLVLLVIIMAQPVAVNHAATDKPGLVASLLWEKAGNNARVLAEMDGKALVLFQNNDSTLNTIEFIDLETGKNLWVGMKNDIGEFVKQKYLYPSWLFLKDLGLLYIMKDNSELTCFAFDTGAKVWQSPDDFEWPLPRCVENGVAYGYAHTGDYFKGSQFIIGYDVKAGKEYSKIQLNTAVSGNHGSIFGKSGDELFYNVWGYVYSVNIKTLKERILIRDDGFGLSNDQDYVYSDGKIIARTGVYDDKCHLLDKIVCFDPATNRIVWSYNGLNNFVVVDNTVVFTSYEADCKTFIKYFTAFVDVNTGKTIKQIFDRSNHFTIYNSDGNTIAAITNANADYTKLTIFDIEGNMLLSENIDDYCYFDYTSHIFYTGDKVILPCSGYLSDKNRWSTLQCYELIDRSLSEVVLKNEFSVEDYKLIYANKNLTFLAKLDDDGKIADLSLVDSMTGKDMWPNNNTLLEKALLGRPWNGLEYSFNFNEFYTTTFDNGKKTALACFDILTGKLLWKSEKLKDYSPPKLYPFVCASNGKDGNVYELDKHYGWTIKHYILKNQSKPFSIVGMNELAMVIFDGQYSMYYYKSGTKGWTSNDILPKDPNQLNALLIGNVFVSLVQTRSDSIMFGRDVFSGKTLWSKNIDGKFTFGKSMLIATNSNKTDGTCQSMLIDPKTGDTKDSKIIPKELTGGFKLENISNYGFLISLFLQNSGKSSRILMFDNNLDYLCSRDFDGKQITQTKTGLGRVAVTLEDMQSKTIQTVLMRFARVKSK